MATCQLVRFTDAAEHVLLDIVALESLVVRGTPVPRGTPLALSFVPGDDPVQHREMAALLDRWADQDGVLDLEVGVAHEIGGIRYVFTCEDEQLVLDVRA